MRLVFILLWGLAGAAEGEEVGADVDEQQPQVTVGYLRGAASSSSKKGGSEGRRIEGAVLSWTSKTLLGGAAESRPRAAKKSRGSAEVAGPRLKIDWLTKDSIKVHWANIGSLPSKPVLSSQQEVAKSVTNVVMPLILIDTSKFQGNIDDILLSGQDEGVKGGASEGTVGRGKSANGQSASRSSVRSLPGPGGNRGPPESSRKGATGPKPSSEINTEKKLNDPECNGASSKLVRIIWEEPVLFYSDPFAKLPASVLPRGFPPARSFSYYPRDFPQDRWPWYPLYKCPERSYCLYQEPNWQY